MQTWQPENALPGWLARRRHTKKTCIVESRKIGDESMALKQLMLTAVLIILLSGGISIAEETAQEGTQETAKETEYVKKAKPLKQKN